MEQRVFGPPGTGKTTFLARQVRRAVEARGQDSVIVASFTKAAAVEMAGRDLPLHESRIGTLHALCYRQLGSPTIAETKAAEFNRAQSVYQVSQDAADMDEPEQKFSSDGDRLMNQYQVYRSRMIDRSSWPVDVLAFAKAWEGWKYENEYIDFTDMIELALAQQIPPPGAPEIGFFDEVQDFTLLELSLVRQWADMMEYIVLAGDDDQCIYSFKGASPYAFLNPPVPDEQKRVLNQSWRMPRRIHEWSQRWISQVSEREEKAFKPQDREGNVWFRPELRYRAPGPMVDEMQAIAASGQDAMVIGACSYQIAPIVNELRRRGEVFHNPYRRKRGDWNPLSGSRKGSVSTKDRIAAFARPNRAVWADDAHPWTYEDLRRWIPLVRKTGVIKRGMAKVLDKGAATDPVSMQVLDAVFEENALMPALTCKLDWLLDHAASDKQRAMEYPVRVIQNQGWAKLWDRPRIIVGTIHSVKGGEADTVYLLPDLSQAGMMEYSNDATIDNVVRQFYVGATRAKENLILCGRSMPFAVNWGRE